MVHTHGIKVPILKRIFNCDEGNVGEQEIAEGLPREINIERKSKMDMVKGIMDKLSLERINYEGFAVMFL